MIFKKWEEKAGKWEVPLPVVCAQAGTEALKVVQTGSRKKKAKKRMVTKVCFVGDGFTGKPPKYERFTRPMGLRFTRAQLTHGELKTTFCLPVLGAKKNPSSHFIQCWVFLPKALPSRYKWASWTWRHKEARLFGENMHRFPAILKMMDA